MRFYFDESGDFEFGKAGFDCSSQAAIAVPDSVYPRLERFVDRKCKQWDVDELHAKDLNGPQIVTVCQAIAAEPLEIAAHVFDNLNNTPAEVAAWRHAQADRVALGRKRYVEEGVGAAEIVAFMTKIERWVRGPKPRDSQFIQGWFWVSVIHEALAKCLVEFHAERWRPDFEKLIFALDAKIPNKLDAGEKLMRDSIGPILDSNPNHYRLAMLDTWAEEPVHPFVRNFDSDTKDGTDVRKMFLDNLHFEDSRDHPGIQLADAVAYVIRKAVLEPTNRPMQEAYHLLRPKLRTPEGGGFGVMTIRNGPDKTTDNRPYDHLAVVRRRPPAKRWIGRA